MRALRALILRLGGVFRKTQIERELTSELQSHLELHIADNIRAGMPPDEARRQARIALGGVEQTKEQYRDRRRLGFIEELVRDMRSATQLLRRDRAFTLTAVLVLGFGIGMSNTFFTIVNAMCIRGLTVDDPKTIMDISTSDGGGRERRMSYQDMEDVRRSTKTFSRIAAFAPRNPAPMSLADDDRAPERFMGTFVSAEMFSLIGERPLVGRDFREEDDRQNAPPVVILGSTAWRERYGGDLSVIGRTIRVNGEPALVIGVMPARSKFPNNTEIWQPLGQMPALEREKRDTRNLSMFGRLADGRAPAEAHGELQSVGLRLAHEHPETNRGFQIVVTPVNEKYVVPINHPAWITFVAVGVLVLVVACFNVANLLLMRSTGRAREIAVRASLGATRGRIIRQLLMESAVLAIAGGALGVALSAVGSRLLWRSIPADTLPYWMSYAPDLRGLAFIATICLGSSIIFGLAPAVHLSRTDVNGVLKDGGRTATKGISARRWTSALLAAQFGLAMIFGTLITQNLLMLRAVKHSDPPIANSSIATAAIALPPKSYATPERRQRFFADLDARLKNVQGLSSWSLVSHLPLREATTQRLVIQGRTEQDKEARNISTIAIGPAYFETLGLAMVRGRAFDDRDGNPGSESAIVNQKFASVYFPGEDPIGQRLRIFAEGATQPAAWREIVGVSRTIRQRDRPDPDPIVYLPAKELAAASISLIARGSGRPDELITAMREALRRLDPDLPLFRVMTLEQATEEAHWNGRVSNVLALSISLLALGLAAVGLYAVTAHSVSQRTAEIGVRMALGAEPWRLAWLTLKRAAYQVASGILLGVGFAFAWDRAFKAEGAVRITAPDNLIGAALGIAVIGLVACLVPVLRATRVNPVVVLRYE